MIVTASGFADAMAQRLVNMASSVFLTEGSLFTEMPGPSVKTGRL
jgi:hypothetical protein